MTVWRIIRTAPLWIWDRPARRDAITLLMWAVPMRARGRVYGALGRWFMRRWHRPRAARAGGGE